MSIRILHGQNLIKLETDRKMNQWWKLIFFLDLILYFLWFQIVYYPVTMSIHLDRISNYSTKTTKILHIVIAAWFMEYVFVISTREKIDVMYEILYLFDKFIYLYHFTKKKSFHWFKIKVIIFPNFNPTSIVDNAIKTFKLKEISCNSSA